MHEFINAFVASLTDGAVLCQLAVDPGSDAVEPRSLSFENNPLAPREGGRQPKSTAA